MEKVVPRMFILPGVKAVYRNGDLIYQYQECQESIGINEEDDLRITSDDDP